MVHSEKDSQSARVRNVRLLVCETSVCACETSDCACVKNKATTYASALVVKVRRMPTTLLNLLLLTALFKGDGEPVVEEMVAGCFPSIVYAVVKIALVAIVVEGRSDRELLSKVAQILGVEREGLVFEVTGDVEFSPIVRGG